MKSVVDVEPDAWATKTMCVGPEFGTVTFGKLPIQSLNPLYYTHEKLYSEKAVIGLMKAAYYEGYTDRERDDLLDENAALPPVIPAELNSVMADAQSWRNLENKIVNPQ